MNSLQRFHEAHGKHFSTAINEIIAGRKQSHWMWYIFPQIAGLGFSDVSQYYAIKDLDEARAYLNDMVLWSHLLGCCNVLLGLETSDAVEIFGHTDSMKLRSSMTLFAIAADTEYAEVFNRVLAKFFNKTYDERTMEITGVKMVFPDQTANAAGAAGEEKIIPATSQF
jgi:uncharacterized protein (DUF1810 family)